MKPRIHTSLPAILGLLALLLAPAGAVADYWDHFKLGRDAVASGQWAAAEKHLRNAIAELPEAKRRPFGARYTPYYYLGVVLQEQGDCRGALAAFKTSEKYNIVKAGSEESVDRAQRKTRCNQLVGDVDRTRADVERAVAEGRSALQGIDRLRPTLGAAWTEGSPSFASRREEASRLLDQVNKESTAAGQSLDLGRLQSAQKAAKKATRDLQNLTAEAETRLDEAGAARSQARRELEETHRSGKELLASVASLQPYPPNLNRRVAGLVRALDRADQQGESADIQELGRLHQELKKAIRALRSRAVRPSEPLQEIAEAYLGHNYEDVMERLETVELQGNRERFHGELLRAASYHGLYVLRGMDDPELLEKAREAIGLCLALDEKGTLGAPGERYFSPAFRKLWTTTRNAATSAEIGAEDAGEESP